MMLEEGNGLIKVCPDLARNTTSLLTCHVRVCYLAYAILTSLEYHLRKSGFSAVEFLEKLRRGYRVHLKDRKSGHRWNTDVLLEKKLYKYFDSLQAAM